MLQVYDSFGIGTKTFSDTEEQDFKEFSCKPPLYHLKTYHIQRHPRQHYSYSPKLDPYPAYRQDLTPRRIHRPEVCFSPTRSREDHSGTVTSWSIRTDPAHSPHYAPTTDEEYKTFRKSTKSKKEWKDQGLDFVNINMDNVRIVLLTFYSFANAKWWKRQIGYFILIADDDVNWKVGQYGSNRCIHI